MPTIGYAVSYQTDPPGTMESLEKACKDAYRDLGIALTGAMWRHFVVDRIRLNKPMRKFRERPVGLEMWGGLRPGDIVIAPKYLRAFMGPADFINNVTRWETGGVRLIVLDIGFDSASELGRKQVALLRALMVKDRRRPRVSKAVAGGRPILGTRTVGKRGERRLMVIPDLYELGLKVRAWAASGQDYIDISLHLFRNGIYRPRSTRIAGRRPVPGSIMGELAWEPPALKRLAENINKINDLVLAGKAALPVGWRPKEGPLVDAMDIAEGRMPHPDRYRKARDIGVRIRQLRREKNWSQKRLAYHCEMLQSRISEIEAGANMPTQETLERIAKPLGVPVEALTVSLRERNRCADSSPEPSSGETSNPDTNTTTPLADSA